jgi:hypothetical protein
MCYGARQTGGSRSSTIWIKIGPEACGPGPASRSRAVPHALSRCHSRSLALSRALIRCSPESDALIRALPESDFPLSESDHCQKVTFSKYAPLFMQHAVAYLRPTLPVSAATSLALLFS